MEAAGSFKQASKSIPESSLNPRSTIELKAEAETETEAETKLKGWRF